MRGLDADAGTAHQPEHSFRTVQPVRAGEEMDVVIPLSSSATLFHPGDSLRVMIGGRYLQPRNPAYGHFPTHYVASTKGSATIICGSEQPSGLEIPVIAAAPAPQRAEAHRHTDSGV